MQYGFSNLLFMGCIKVTRSKFEIYYDELFVCKEGKCFRKIMFLNRRSSETLKKDIEVLKKANLLRETKEKNRGRPRRMFYTTNKGIKFMESFRKTKEFLKEEDNQFCNS